MKKNYLLIIITVIFTLTLTYCNNSKSEEDNSITEDSLQKNTEIVENNANYEKLNIKYNYDSNNIPDSILQDYKFMLLDTNIIFLKDYKLYVYYSGQKDKELFYEGIAIKDFIISDDMQNIIILTEKQDEMSIYTIAFKKNSKETLIKTFSFTELEKYSTYEIDEYSEIFAGNLINANSNKIIFTFLVHEEGMDGSDNMYLSIQIDTKEVKNTEMPEQKEEVLSKKAQKLKEQLLVHEEQLCILKNNETIKYTDTLKGYGFVASISPDASKIYYSYESSWGVGPINTSFIINADGTNLSVVRDYYSMYSGRDENIIWLKNGNLILFDYSIKFIYGNENKVIIIEPEVNKFEVF